MEEANNVIDLIYALEPLCYYFGMKPFEFWNSTYREINLYTEVNAIRLIEDYKKEMQLQEAVTDKTIGASILNKTPKVVSLFDMFSNLFKRNEPKVQTPEEQARIFRSIIKAEKMSNNVEK